MRFGAWNGANESKARALPPSSLAKHPLGRNTLGLHLTYAETARAGFVRFASNASLFS